MQTPKFVFLLFYAHLNRFTPIAIANALTPFEYATRLSNVYTHFKCFTHTFDVPTLQSSTTLQTLHKQLKYYLLNLPISCAWNVLCTVKLPLQILIVFHMF